MSAFFVLGSFGLVVLLMFKGESSRQMQSTRIASSEAGAKLFNVDSKSKAWVYLARSTGASGVLGFRKYIVSIHIVI